MELTKSEKKVFDLFEKYKQGNIPAFYKQMADDLGMSQSNFSHTLIRLKRKGCVIPDSSSSNEFNTSLVDRIVYLEGMVAHLVSPPNTHPNPMTHFITTCSHCKKVISQCKCFNCGRRKRIDVCEDCKK